MEFRKIGVVAILFSIFLVGCNSESASEAENVTPTPSATTEPTTNDIPDWVSIDEGIWGNVLYWEGDFMPGDPTGTKTPVARTIHIYETTTESEAARIDNTTFFEYVDTQLVLVVYSESDGTFQAQLPPGEYSVFVLEDGKLWANLKEIDYETGVSTINPVAVDDDRLSEFNIDIDYAAAY